MINGSIPAIVEQHADDAAFLWSQRELAATSPHYTLSDLAELDDRCEAHLDGLHVAGELGESCSLALIAEDAPGEAFSATVLCTLNRNGDCLKSVLSNGDTENLRGFASALGWLPWTSSSPVAISCIEHNTESRRFIGVTAHAIQRQDPGPHLERLLHDESKLVLARCLKAAGELGRTDCLPLVKAQLESDDESCRFWAAWSCVLLGDVSANESLKTCVNFDTSYAGRALQLAPRVMPPGDSQNWLRGLASQITTRRSALIGCGVVGDPVYIPTLISQMSIPEYARVAGEAFSMITGVDIAYEDLEGEWPEGFEAGPTEDPEDENVDLDPDEDLPWPDQVLIQQWWQDHGGQFQAGQRYLCGQPISPENCQRVLREGYQRQRIAAAYELALMDPSAPLFEWRAPGFRQQEWLGLK